MNTVIPRRSPRLAARREQLVTQQAPQVTQAPTVVAQQPPVLRRSARIAERLAKSRPATTNMTLQTRLEQAQAELKFKPQVDRMRMLLKVYNTENIQDPRTRVTAVTNLFNNINNPWYEELYLTKPLLRTTIKRKAMELPIQLMTVNVPYWIGKLCKDNCERMLCYLQNLEKNPKCVF